VSEAGSAVMGIGRGPAATTDAGGHAPRWPLFPLIDGLDRDGRARAWCLSISGGSDRPFRDNEAAAAGIRAEHQDANIISARSSDDALGDRGRVTVIEAVLRRRQQAKSARASPPRRRDSPGGTRRATGPCTTRCSARSQAEEERGRAGGTIPPSRSADSALARTSWDVQDFQRKELTPVAAVRSPGVADRTARRHSDAIRQR